MEASRQEVRNGFLCTKEMRLCWGGLVLATLLGMLLRLLYLGNVFTSSDNSEMAMRVVNADGNAWMFRGRYGVLISVIIKWSAILATYLRIDISEFWWKLPIALIGSAQAPLTFFFLGRLGCGRAAGLVGAALVAVLPLHVMQSRYLHGYEVIGTFFVTLALWAIVEFLRDPTGKRALVGSLLSSFYLISHGYIMAFPLCILAAIAIYHRAQPSLPSRIFSGIGLMVRKCVWTGPLLFLPMCIASLQYSASKKSQLGVFIAGHFPGFLHNIGVFLFAAIAAGTIAYLIASKVRTPPTLFLLLCGGAYLAPIAFLVPPGITVSRGYMVVGTYFLVLSVASLAEKAISRAPLLALVGLAVCFSGTLWGTVESIFGRDGWVDPSLVTIERGGVPVDPGTKAAGYLVRKYVPSDSQVLALHRAIEHPNLIYYFKRHSIAFNDYSIKRYRKAFLKYGGQADVVNCEEKTRDILSAKPTRPRPAMYSVAVRPAGAIANLSGTSCTMGILEPGGKIYADRSYRFGESIPEQLKGATYISTRNRDRYSTATALLRFDALSSVTVSIMLPDDCAKIPGWMRGWTETEIRIPRKKMRGGIIVFEKRFPPGPIALGSSVSGADAIPRDLEERTVIYSEGKPQMWIYARPGIPLPEGRVDSETLNPLFDKDYSRTIRKRIRNCMW